MQSQSIRMVFAVLVPLVLADPGYAEHGEQSGHDRAPANVDYSLDGHPTQRIKPSQIRGRLRPDGSYSVITGQQRDEKGRITVPHSHSVVRDGKVAYSRTSGGTVVHDDIPRGGGPRPDGGLGPRGGGGMPRGGAPGGGRMYLK